MESSKPPGPLPGPLPNTADRLYAMGLSGTYCKCTRLLRLQHHASWAIYESEQESAPGSGVEPDGIEGSEDLP